MNNSTMIKKRSSKKVTKKPTFSSIEKFFKTFGIDELLSNISERNGNYFLFEPKLKLKIDEIKEKIFSAGLFIGNTKKGNFYPSIALIDIISKNDYGISEVIIDKKTEWLFLCGRDIFGSSINKNIPKGYIIIKNEKKEILGLGYGTNDLILNVIDRGDFLRRENKKRKK